MVAPGPAWIPLIPAQPPAYCCPTRLSGCPAPARPVLSAWSLLSRTLTSTPWVTAAPWAGPEPLPLGHLGVAWCPVLPGSLAHRQPHGMEKAQLGH